MPESGAALADPLCQTSPDFRGICGRKLNMLRAALLICLGFLGVFLSWLTSRSRNGVLHLTRAQEASSIAMANQFRSLPKAAKTSMRLLPNIPTRWRSISHAFGAGQLYQSGTLSEFVNLRSGLPLPRMIYRNQLEKGNVEGGVLDAVQAGFRALDLVGPPEAFSAVGAALAKLSERASQGDDESGAARSSLYIQTTITINPSWGEDNADPPGTTAKLVETTIANMLSTLGLEYIDCLVLQMPRVPMYQNDADQVWDATMEAWGVMETAVENGVAKLLGVSAATRGQAKQIFETASEVQPSIVKEPRFKGETRLVMEWCAESDVRFQSSRVISKQPVVREAIEKAAAKYEVSPEVLYSRFNLGIGAVQIVDTADKEILEESALAWAIPLSPDDHTAIDDLLRVNMAQ